MALIKCPECGTEVSDKAIACPKCAYPIAEIANRGKIRIKVYPQSEYYVQQLVSISSNGQLLWQGHTGEIAELKIDQPIRVQIVYHLHSFAERVMFGSQREFPLKAAGECIIDPNKGNKYALKVQEDAYSRNCILQTVDMFEG